MRMTFKPGQGLFAKPIILTSYEISRGKETYSVEEVTAEVTSSGSRRMSVPGYLMITGPAFGWSLKIDHHIERKAREFAVAVNLAARQYTGPNPLLAPPPTGSPMAPQAQVQLHPGTSRPCGRWCRSDH